MSESNHTGLEESGAITIKAHCLGMIMGDKCFINLCSTEERVSLLQLLSVAGMLNKLRVKTDWKKSLNKFTLATSSLALDSSKKTVGGMLPPFLREQIYIDGTLRISSFLDELPLKVALGLLTCNTV